MASPLADPDVVVMELVDAHLGRLGGGSGGEGKGGRDDREEADPDAGAHARQAALSTCDGEVKSHAFHAVRRERRGTALCGGRPGSITVSSGVNMLAGPESN